MRDWQTRVLVTLIEEFEFELLSVSDLPENARVFGFRWFHLPIVDVWVPDLMFEEDWERAGEELRQILRQDRQDRASLSGRAWADRDHCCAAAGGIRHGSARGYSAGAGCPNGGYSDQGAGGVCVEVYAMIGWDVVV